MDLNYQLNQPDLDMMEQIRSYEVMDDVHFFLSFSISLSLPFPSPFSFIFIFNYLFFNRINSFLSL